MALERSIINNWGGGGGGELNPDWHCSYHHLSQWTPLYSYHYDPKYDFDAIRLLLRQLLKLTTPEEAVWSGSTLFAILSASFRHCSNFRTLQQSGVLNFCNFTVSLLLTKWCRYFGKATSTTHASWGWNSELLHVCSPKMFAFPKQPEIFIFRYFYLFFSCKLSTCFMLMYHKQCPINQLSF